MWKRVSRSLLLLPGLLASGCFSARYIAQQAGGQLHLLRSRRPVSSVLADPNTPLFVRQRLELVMAARQFGIDTYGLSGGGEFTRYVDPGGPVAYNLSVAHSDRFALLTWTFPLVGRVPYLGFFDKADAQAQARKYQQDGYDVELRSVSAYSTLGYFLSPIYASMIDDPGPAGEVRAVETILHEMTHTTAYLRSASELNESFATVVGIEGAAQFFRQRGSLAQSALVRQLADEDEARHKVFSTWLVGALRTAQEFYQQAAANHHPPAQILRAREALFAQLQASYRATFPTGPRYKKLAEGPINNALLLSFGVYHSSADFQKRLLRSVGGDLRAFVALYRRAQARSDGAAWLYALGG